MFFYFLLVTGFGLLLWLVVSLAKDGAKIAQENEVLKELEKQKENAKDKDKLTDDELLKELEKLKKAGLILLLFILASCKTELKTSECAWYREPSADQCQNLYNYDRDLFRLCTLNKLDYRENCKKD